MDPAVICGADHPLTKHRAHLLKRGMKALLIADCKADAMTRRHLDYGFALKQARCKRFFDQKVFLRVYCGPRDLEVRVGRRRDDHGFEAGCLKELFDPDANALY